tara:strand:- start:1392 stop:1682 length:291 start_codon:yes stop_codon:yes gene_type:complete
MSKKRSIYIGKDRTDPRLMAEKIQNDIDFLNAKIIHIKGQRAPNIEVLQTYQAMLESRYSVLEWITYTPVIINIEPTSFTTMSYAMESSSVADSVA